MQHMINYIKPVWPAPPQIKAYTTTRHAWIGTKPEENSHLQTLLGLPEQPVWITQKHTNIAVPALPHNQAQIADACFTDASNRVCAVLTADCLPLLICSQSGSKIAAIHAGWRGLAAGIIENTVQSLHLPADELMVWLGPAISRKKFEVGREVYEAFTHKNEESAAAFVPHADEKWLADLYSLAAIRLRLLGIQQIYGGEFCTYLQDDLFFSYRRDRGRKGSMVSLIWINEE